VNQPNMILAVNYYEILELSRTASQDEVKAAYKKMAAVVHPDKGGSAMLFRLVQEAYEALSDPAKRKQHDSDLAGPSGGNRQSGSQQQQQQQQQSQTSQTEPNYIRVEDAYKRWKENRNRVAMPREESIAAGGVRKMIRDSVAFSFTDQKIDAIDFGFCSNCGWETKGMVVKHLHPMRLMNIAGGTIRNQGENLGWCDRCKKSLGIFQEVKWSWTESKWLGEEIRIDKGDLLFFVNVHLGGVIPMRSVFGFVIEGTARNEFGLRGIKVLDEFSGKVITPAKWNSVMGHWKSNDLLKDRTGALRNWSV
jgi:hypothetical protein